MGNKIAVNAKYFKASQAKAVKGHICRLFAENKNVIPERTKFNYGHNDEVINTNYNLALAQMKGAKKNSNTLVDAVLVLPIEQWNKMNKILSDKDLMTKKTLGTCVSRIMHQIECEFGLKPIGFKLHLDEGHKDKNGKFILNPHIHMLFANICTKDVTLRLTRKVTLKDETGKAMRNPKQLKKWLYKQDNRGVVIEESYDVKLNGKMPLQYLQGRGKNSPWSRIQDIAAHYLTPFGFERGISKDITKRNHLEKTEHVAAVKLRKEVNQMRIDHEALNAESAKLRSRIAFEKEALNTENVAVVKLRKEVDQMRIDHENLNIENAKLRSSVSFQKEVFNSVFQDVIKKLEEWIKGDIGAIKLANSIADDLNDFDVIGELPSLIKSAEIKHNISGEAMISSKLRNRPRM